MSEFRTNRLFSMQLADHDGLFGPRRKQPSKRRFLRLLILVPAFCIWLLPSFKLGRVTYVQPSFQIPDSIEAGSAFTLPVDSSLASIRAQGHPLVLVKKPVVWIGAVPAANALDLSLIFKTPLKKWNFRALLPRFEHPTAAVFAKTVRVDNQPPAPAIGETPKDVSGLSRSDGLADAACWHEPKISLMEQPIARRTRRGVTPKLVSVSSAASGEVVRIEGTKDTDRTVLLYHGGGLYSFYKGLHDTKLKMGEKLIGGQSVGAMVAGNKHHEISVDWEVFLEKNELNPVHFLALSQQLCDSK